MDLQRLQQLAGLPLTESKQILTERYEESADFDADMDKIEKLLKDALSIARSSNLVSHAKDTDKNFDVPNLKDKFSDMTFKIQQAISSVKDFYEEMEKAA